MTTLADALAFRADLARSVAKGTAKMSAAYTVDASTYGGPRDSPDYTGYHVEDLRSWCYPDPFACAELSTNPDADIADLDYRALMMLLPIEQRRILIAQRVEGDPKTGLPHRWPFRITTLTGQHVTAAKLDVGRGAPPVNGVIRAVDIFWIAAAWLGVETERIGSFLGPVTVQIALP